MRIVKQFLNFENLLSLLHLIYIHAQISSKVLKNAASVHFLLRTVGRIKEICIEVLKIGQEDRFLGQSSLGLNSLSITY